MGLRESAGITLIESHQAPLLARPYYVDGDPGPIVAALAQVPELLVVTMPFLGAVLGPVVDPAARVRLLGFFAEHEVELTLLAASTLLLNRFCTALELPTSSCSVLARLAAEGLG